jgi:hypothetical protein
MRFPSGSSLGKYLPTVAALTMTTGSPPCESLDEKSRPPSMAMPMTSKYAGVTDCAPTSSTAAPASGAGRPSTIKVAIATYQNLICKATRGIRPG